MVYGRFAALTALSAELGGWMLLYRGLEHDSIAVAMAANVAGAASLGVEPDAERAKAALRAGACDFVVKNNLGEALRILKNEIRVKKGVSVVLEADADSAVREMVERGVQPEVLAFPVPELVERGARVLAEDAPDGMLPMSWRVDREPFRWLRVLDELAVGALDARNARARWVEASPRYLGREFANQRFVRMTEPESERFEAAVREQVKAGTIPVVATIHRGGNTVSIGS